MSKKTKKSLDVQLVELLQTENRIMKKLLVEVIKDRHICLNDAHEIIFRWAKRLREDPEELKQVAFSILQTGFHEKFAENFSKEPRPRHHHHGGGH